MKFWRAPLDHDQIEIPQGRITIISSRCKGCEVCETYCPRHVLTMSTTFNAKGYHIPEVIDVEACVACGLCQIMCPEFAIYVTEIREPILNLQSQIPNTQSPISKRTAA